MSCSLSIVDWLAIIVRLSRRCRRLRSRSFGSSPGPSDRRLPPRRCARLPGQVDVYKRQDKRSLKARPTIYKAATGATALEDATTVGVKFENVAMKYAGFNLGLTKQILTTLGKNVPLGNRTFSFALYEGENPSEEATPVAEGDTDDATGKLDLQIADGKYAKEAFEQNAAENTFTFTLKETPLEGDDASSVSYTHLDVYKRQ